MTTPGYKRCTLCGEEMIIDAVLCPHCGRIPGRGKAPPSTPYPRAPRRTRRAMGIALAVVSLAAVTAGLARSDETLLLAGAIALALGGGLWLFAGR